MSDLIPFDQGFVPQYAQDHAAATALAAGLGEYGPRITLRGSRFRVSSGGEERLVEAHHLDVILLGSTAAVGRTYFDTTYDPNSDGDSSPACWSSDGRAPDAGTPRTPLLPTGAVAGSCAVCPKNEKGSGQDGKTRACGFVKNLAVMLYGDASGTIYTLKCGGQTIFGEVRGAQGQYSLQGFSQLLATKGAAPHSIVTRLTFDPNSSTPKLLLQPIAFLSADQFQAVSAFVAAKGDEIAKVVRIGASGAAAPVAPAAPALAPPSVNPAPAALAAPAMPVAAPAMPVAAPAMPVAAPAMPVAAPAMPVAAPAMPVAAPAMPVAAPAMPVAAPATPATTAAPIVTSMEDLQSLIAGFGTAAQQ